MMRALSGNFSSGSASSALSGFTCRLVVRAIVLERESASLVRCARTATSCSGKVAKMLSTRSEKVARIKLLECSRIPKVCSRTPLHIRYGPEPPSSQHTRITPQETIPRQGVLCYHDLPSNPSFRMEDAKRPASCDVRRSRTEEQLLSQRNDEER
jgi:hypothetical protein